MEKVIEETTCKKAHTKEAKMKYVKRMHQNLAYISLGLLAVSILLLIIFSHKISYPIEVLARQMRRLKDLDISRDPLPESHLKEIVDIAEALDLVEDSLSTFSKYVPKQLVLDLIQSGAHQHLGGEVKKLTIFFSDIENFTGIAETLSSEQLMENLTFYFNELTSSILQEHGTIDKFIGDSVMAFWGAPREDADQVIHGCRALLKCYEITKAPRHSEGLKRPHFKTRFSLHQADVVVGNVGSSDRMNYTIIGDGVNIANRLEGTNKIYGTRILVTETIYSQAKKDFLFRVVDKVIFQGKQTGGLIYELIMEINTQNAYYQAKEWADLSTKAFEYYQEQHWVMAKTLYLQVLALKQDDSVARIFIDRCDIFLNTPPTDWDGVCRLQTK